MQYKMLPVWIKEMCESRKFRKALISTMKIDSTRITVIGNWDRGYGYQYQELNKGHNAWYQMHRYGMIPQTWVSVNINAMWVNKLENGSFVCRDIQHKNTTMISLWDWHDDEEKPMTIENMRKLAAPNSQASDRLQEIKKSKLRKAAKYFNEIGVLPNYVGYSWIDTHKGTKFARSALSVFGYDYDRNTEVIYELEEYSS
jgi:hypothetical protein